MPSKLHIGNLSYKTSSEDLRERFAEYGPVVDCIVIEDRETRRSRGFGFVTFDSEDEANAAIEALNEQEVDGRRIRVSHASERVERGGGGGSYGRDRGGYDRERGERGSGGYGRDRGGYDRERGERGSGGYGREDRHRDY